MMRKCILVLGLTMVLGACHSDKIPSDVLTPAEMKPVMWDLFAAGELKISDTASAVRLHLMDSTTSLFSYVLRVHKLSQDTFLHSFKYYERNPDKQLILIDSLVDYNDRLVKLYEKKYHQEDSIRQKKEHPKLDTLAKPNVPARHTAIPVPIDSAKRSRLKLLREKRLRAKVLPK
ncbi:MULTISPECIES: DUF4296 domain-containing protein [Chitinophagaceae]